MPFFVQKDPPNFSSVLRSLTFPFFVSLQGAMGVAWAHQDCSGPLNQSEKRAEKMKQLQAQVIDLENRLRVKDEELKNNEVELVAQTVKYEKLQDELGLLKGDLARFDADNRPLKSKLNEAREEIGTATVKTVSEYQSSAKMAALKQTIRDETYEEAVESFVYTTTIWHPDWDLSYLGDHLAAQIAEWHAEAQASHPPAEERPAAVVPPVEEIQEVPVPLPDSLPEQVIEGEQEPAIRLVESDASIEKIDNPDGIVDCQE